MNTLSDKEMIMRDYPYYGFSKADVKEAVKKLKEGLFGGRRRLEDNQAIEFIDEIFGEKLI